MTKEEVQAMIDAAIAAERKRIQHQLLAIRESVDKCSREAVTQRTLWDLLDDLDTAFH